MSLKSKGLFFILGSGLCGTLSAQTLPSEPPFQRTGLRQVEIKTSEILTDGTQASKIISFHTIIPSEDFINRKIGALKKAKLASTELNYANGIIPFAQSPGAVDLGMNNTPVLDQGQEGTCVTFATTGAMDALLGQGDFVSQQCSLELDLALLQDYWNGADYASQIIEPLKLFGIIQQGNCNATYPNPYALIALWSYKALASKTVTAQNISYTYTNGISLDTVKAAIKAGNRVTIGFGLDVTNDPISTQGFNMLISGETTAGGLWACQQPSSTTNYCGTPTDGHDVIVIGYDDAQQLLKIRNSWNTTVGDNGDFYMTYTYFNAMNGDGTEIFDTTGA